VAYGAGLAKVPWAPAVEALRVRAGSAGGSGFMVVYSNRIVSLFVQVRGMGEVEVGF
jgi:hypothetical protein